MASWLKHCSSARRAPRQTELTRQQCAQRWASVLCLALVSTSCGRAAVPSLTVDESAAGVAAAPGNGGANPTGTALPGAQALCSPASMGRLQARLQGALE